MGPEMKERLGMVIDLFKTAFHWGYIPAIIYFGKELSILNSARGMEFGDCLDIVWGPL